MKYAEWITHQGKQILIIHAQNAGEQELQAAMTELRDEMAKKPDAYTLIDLTGVHMTPRMSDIAKSLNKEINAIQEKAGQPMQPSALVGIRPIVRAVVQLISRNEKTYYASSYEDALEWLMKH